MNVYKKRWCEEDPMEILESVKKCIGDAADKCHEMNVDLSQIKAIGITNQRETTIVWDKLTGKPLHNAIGNLNPYFLILLCFNRLIICYR